MLHYKSIELRVEFQSSQMINVQCHFKSGVFLPVCSKIKLHIDTHFHQDSERFISTQKKKIRTACRMDLLTRTIKKALILRFLFYLQ